MDGHGIVVGWLRWVAEDDDLSRTLPRWASRVNGAHLGGAMTSPGSPSRRAGSHVGQPRCSRWSQFDVAQIVSDSLSVTDVDGDLGICLRCGCVGLWQWARSRCCGAVIRGRDGCGYAEAGDAWQKAVDGGGGREVRQGVVSVVWHRQPPVWGGAQT